MIVRRLLALSAGLLVAGCCSDVKHFFFKVLAGTYDSASVPLPSDFCRAASGEPSGGRVLVISDDRKRVTETFERDGKSYRIDYDVVRIERLERARQRD